MTTWMIFLIVMMVVTVMMMAMEMEEMEEMEEMTMMAIRIPRREHHDKQGAMQCEKIIHQRVGVRIHKLDQEIIGSM
ncbi:hypothetical protein SAMN02745216_03706 [Desulfatibacillum alkenivorans DSM 16219]|uniref:Uncharacterized protein n=1 Tax=Desulfatibacillum alkenivorans DSM 16219 TaxID=1121393 RepID=A0A1M6TK61_9BACT|nr:hypothetical protein SAMN02745216_03706 [Desulfatibacillum alkenivorans DSM 16219]